MTVVGCVRSRSKHRCYFLLTAQHRITGDLVTKYLKKDLQELLSPGNLPAMFVDLLHEVGKEFEDVFSRLQRVCNSSCKGLSTSIYERLRDV